ncbi:MAG: hypothetical protein JSS96_00575 [Bacteroidetes bacterium]|nr:hypothetical protein [Bacteroidota bacterium]
MKKILMALIMIGCINYSADAQTRKTHRSKYDINYKICKYEDGYHVCGTQPRSEMDMTSSGTYQQNNVNSYEGYRRDYALQQDNIIVRYDDAEAYNVDLGACSDNSGEYNNNQQQTNTDRNW